MARLGGLVTIGLALVVSGCRTHPQTEGSYAFSWSVLLLDDCNAYAGTTNIGTGALELVGDDVQVLFQPFTVNLRGEYRDKAESFFIDGSASNVPATLGGHACALDMIQYHFDGDTQSPTTFVGTARVTTTSIDDAACRCQAKGSYVAVLQ